LASGRDVGLFSSRRLIQGRDPAEHLAVGEIVSTSLVKIMSPLEVQPRWLIAKGGITSSDIATRALGQALPGVPVWRAEAESKWPGLAYIVFPGNVGGTDALAKLVGSLSTPA